VRKQQNANDASAGLNSTFSVSVQDARRHYEDFIDKLLSPFPGDNLAGESFRFTWVRWYGTSLPRVWPAILFWTVYATVIVLIAELGGYLTAIMAPSQAIVSLIGFAASLLLGFRTNSAYERWYEGRRLFETACSRVREVTRYWSSYFPPNTPAERAQQLNACRAGVAYVYARRCRDFRFTNSRPFLTHWAASPPPQLCIICVTRIRWSTKIARTSFLGPRTATLPSKRTTRRHSVSTLSQPKVSFRYLGFTNLDLRSTI